MLNPIVTPQPTVSTTSQSPCQTNKSTGKRPNASEGGKEREREFEWSRTTSRLVLEQDHEKSCSSHHSAGSFKNNFPSDFWLAKTCRSHLISNQREIFPCRRLDTDVTRALECRHRYHDRPQVNPQYSEGQLNQSSEPLGTKIFRLRRENI